WLANWFVENGWSIKKLNRLILASATYRQASRVTSEELRVTSEGLGFTRHSLLVTRHSADSQCRLLWRFPYRRLEVEAVRASGLAVSGQLNREMGGPGVFLPIPKEALEGHSDPKTVWTPSDEWSASRRTVYAVVKRSLTNPLLETLDLCDTARSTA